VADEARAAAAPQARQHPALAANADAHAIAEAERHGPVAEDAPRDSFQFVDPQLALELLVRQVRDREAEAPRQPADPLGIPVFDRVEDDLPAVAEAPAGPHPLEMLVLRP